MEDKYISQYTHEAEQARLERIIKRLWILVIIVFVALIVTNGAWIYYESQWEVVEETTTEQTVTQDVRAKRHIQKREPNIQTFEGVGFSCILFFY